MFGEGVCYNGVRCKLIWNYGNGKSEILFVDEVLLVEENDLVKQEDCPICKSNTDSYLDHEF